MKIVKKNIPIIILFVAIQSFSQENKDCADCSFPYWASGINSRIEGENPTLRKAFKEIQLHEINIKPSNGWGMFSKSTKSFDLAIEKEIIY